MQPVRKNPRILNRALSVVGKALPERGPLFVRDTSSLLADFLRVGADSALQSYTRSSRYFDMCEQS
jgi:hypothetical protein